MFDTRALGAPNLSSRDVLPARAGREEAAMPIEFDPGDGARPFRALCEAYPGEAAGVPEGELP